MTGFTSLGRSWRDIAFRHKKAQRERISLNQESGVAIKPLSFMKYYHLDWLYFIAFFFFFF